MRVSVSAFRKVRRFDALAKAKKKGCPKCGAGWGRVSHLPVAEGADPLFVYSCKKGHTFKKVFTHDSDEPAVDKVISGE